MTPTQLQYLKVINDYLEKNNWHPSTEEICSLVGLSPRSKNAVHEVVHRLNEAGLLDLKTFPGKKGYSAMRMTAKGHEALRLTPMPTNPISGHKGDGLDRW